MLSANDLKVSFDDRILFEGLTIGVDAGERIALVGQNGVGKSTLLKILAGERKPESGRVDRQRDARVGYLAQEPQLDLALTAHETAALGLGRLKAAISDYEAAGKGLEANPEDAQLLNRHTALLAEIERLGGFDAEHRVDRVLTVLGVKDPSVLVGNLSGGGRRRVALAALMVARPEVMLLDEPTNHLDAASIAWLKGELRSHPGAVIFITHDRAFLDDVATRVAELADSRIYVHGPTYGDYLEGRMDRLELQQRTAHRRDRVLARELSWLRAGTPARTTKQQARIKRAEEMLVQAGKPVGPKAMEARRQSTGRLARTILEFRNCTLGYGDKIILKDLNLILLEGQRIGLVGPNGAGKTTLLKAALGELQPLSGQVIKGPHTTMAYFDQHRAALDDTATVRDSVTQETHVDVEGRRVHINGYMEGYLFHSDDMTRRVASLSGGERNRLLLARMMLKGCNLLVMDEPTNDLDHDTQGVLEEILEEHSGCALISSHDERFLDHVATAILAISPDGTWELFPGNFEMYQTLKKQRAQRDAAAEAAARAPSPVAVAADKAKTAAPSKTKMTFKEQRELEGMEATIMAKETAAAALQAQTEAPDFYKSGAAKTKEVMEALAAAQAEVAALYQRWEALEARRN